MPVTPGAIMMFSPPWRLRSSRARRMSRSSMWSVIRPRPSTRIRRSSSPDPAAPGRGVPRPPPASAPASAPRRGSPLGPRPSAAAPPRAPGAVAASGRPRTVVGAGSTAAAPGPAAEAEAPDRPPARRRRIGSASIDPRPPPNPASPAPGPRRPAFARSPTDVVSLLSSPAPWQTLRILRLITIVRPGSHGRIRRRARGRALT